MDTRDASSQQTAEHAMALDLCSRLTLLPDEAMVLQRILEIFSMLFAPRRITFWVMENGNPARTLIYPELQSTPGWISGTPSQTVTRPDPGWVLPDTIPDGFRLRIPCKDETIGIIQVDGLAFPEYQERHLSLALAVAGACGLAIVNARTRRRP